MIRLPMIGAVLLAMLVPAGAEEEGKALYERHCLTCHQADGGGVPFLQPPLVDSLVVLGAPETLIAWTILGTPRNSGPSEYGNPMPGFPQLSDDDIAAILTYIRHAFPHRERLDEPDVPADLVAEIRKDFEG